MIKFDQTNMSLNIYKPHIITKINQGFIEGVKSLMTFNSTATPYKGVMRNQETDTKRS